MSVTVGDKNIITKVMEKKKAQVYQPKVNLESLVFVLFQIGWMVQLLNTITKQETQV